MGRLLCFALTTAWAAAQFVTPTPSVMPSWVVPYPGAVPQTRQMWNTVESSYTVSSAAPHDVLAHFRTLFASARVPFQPDPMGGGFVIRAALPECDLDIGIRRRDPDTTVKVTCSPRLADTQRIVDEHAQERARQIQNDPMKKFDSPVYPQPKSVVALEWPSWLVCVDGSKLAVQKFPGILKSSFTSQPTREAIQAFYANLIGSHGYRVSQGLAAVPEKFGSWVQATAEKDSELGRRVVIWVKIRPAGSDFAVDLSVQ